MYNTDLPTRAELPTSARLWRSTILASIAALVLLVTIILPSEYDIDPTGVGRLLGLSQMGEIKVQLAREAETDRQAAAQMATASSTSAPTQIESRLSGIEKRLDTIALILSTGFQSSSVPEPVLEAPLVETAEAAPVSPPDVVAGWQHDVSFTLQPGEAIELKLVMLEGAEAEFEWTANGSVLNFDTHGDGNGNSVSYDKGRGVPEQSGILRAAFTGNHGWFWRNRTDQPLTLTLRTRGDYSELKRMV